MRQSSRSSHRTPSVRDLVMCSNFTNVRPLIIWQTKGQREQHDLAGLTGIGEGKRGSGGVDDGEERRRRGSKTRVKYQQTSAGGLPRYRSWREESPPPRPRGKSCSRIRSYSRGRSRSPRKAGEPGPGILKGRSATHDGRKREGSMVGWKMLRINRVDEVREFSPWSEDDLEIRVEGDIASRQELKVQSAKDKLDDTKMADDDKKAHDDAMIDKNECSVQITITPTRRVAKIIKHKKLIKHVVVAGGEKLEKTEQADREDFAKDSDCVEGTTAAMEHDGNNNDLSEIKVQEDDTKEESFYGFDPLLERDPQLPVAAGYEAVIDQLESEGPSQAGLLEVKFSGDYESRPVQCVHKDCQATSLPSTLELLPLPRSGHQWLCPAHSECLLCPEPTSLSTCVRCTVCARLYHTTHLDMEEEFQDKVERELFICKLCSDPSQFIQLGEEQREEPGNEAVPRLFFPLPRQMLPSNFQPSPAPKYTKIKPRALSTTQASPKQRSVTTSRGKPLQHTDPSLPPGWHRELVKSSDSRWRVVIIGPDGRRFWSKSDIKKAFSGQGMGGIKWEEFNFSVFGPK